MLIYHHFARFGWEMHIGCGALESKTECVFFPPPRSSSTWRRPTPWLAHSNEHSGGHSKHTPWNALWLHMPPRIRCPPYRPYHCHCHPFPIRCYHIWCGDRTHRKVRHMCSQRLLPRRHKYPAQVTDTCTSLSNHISALTQR